MIVQEMSPTGGITVLLGLQVVKGPFPHDFLFQVAKILHMRLICHHYTQLNTLYVVGTKDKPFAQECDFCSSEILVKLIIYS